MGHQYELPRYDGPAARLVAKEMSKAKYETNKYKLKKDPKAEQTSKFSTLQEAIEGNMLTFEAKKEKNPKKAKDIEREQVEYLLDVIPFVRDYGKHEDVEEEDTDDTSLYHVKSKNKNNKTFQQYLYAVEKVVNQSTLHSVTEQRTVDSQYTCECGTPLEDHRSVSELVCPACGKCTYVLDSDDVTEQNEGMAYKRLNHLTECLNALQGKEGTTVPQEVIEAVRAEFKKNRISSTSEIKPSKVKQYLKKLGYSSYYENIHTIANVISGVPTLKLSLELEKRFKDMFVQIQDPFFRHKPEKRKNFLSYNYVLYKFSELLGEDDLLPFFTLLKCQKNLHAQDQIWKKICEDLRWEFISTT